MPALDRLTVYPIKGLPGTDLDSAAVLPGGTLACDREFVLRDADGEVVNGKRTDRVHDLDTAFDPESYALTVTPRDGPAREFDLAADPDRAAAWFSDFFGLDLSMERDEQLGFVDRRGMGPSVVSTATLETVASWFDGMSVDSARRRLRANVEIGGVDPFWEDRFLGSDAPSFAVDGVSLEGIKPCGRCVVPERDPDTGERERDFRERFLEKRAETFPEWADEDAFDHLYAVMILTRVPEGDRGGTVRVGDDVEIIEASG